MRKIATVIGLVLLFCGDLQAKAYFFKRSELVEKSLVIAIIELEEPEAAKGSDGGGDPFADQAAGKVWNYAKSSKAKVIQSIKGEIAKEFVIHGEESFICARCPLSKGRFLAFLQKDRDLWVGTNWHLSLRPIKDGKIEWYDGEDLSKPMTFQNETAVLAEIRDLLKKAPKVKEPDKNEKNVPIRIKTKFVEAGSGTEEKSFDWIVAPFEW